MTTPRIALVTGASRGIGQAIAMQLAREGMTVVGTATTEQGAGKISQYFEEARLTGKGMMLNVNDTQGIEQLYKNIQSEFGDLSILVNNAAITKDNLLLRMKTEEWQDVIDTNLTAVFQLTRLCLKSMLKARWGRIVSISSVVGSMGNAGQTNYAAAKAGVIGFSKSLAQEIASRNITVNVVSPGFIDTDMTKDLPEDHRTNLLSRIPAQRLGTPADIADAVAFLTSDKASYITGATLHVNGGMYME
ncbi:MAG: 3-oxoacyl-ACP reductase FabG [Proteobacteria bacterium]|nr:3-oxoacyl-ACP reductase FabG [Pseudomonadota bacterium]